MSGQSTPCRMQNFGKQGPMKATIPMSSVLKQNSNLKNETSPNISPTYFVKARFSPDAHFGQRSPGASSCKGKSKLDYCTHEGKMRRTASLDTIYLKGHWPRDNFYWNTGTLQINKSTQTDDADWSDRKIHSISETEDKIVMKQKVRSGKDSSSRHGSPDTLNSSSQTLTSCIASPTMKPHTMSIAMKPIQKSNIRSSIEGLNQEIEHIVLKTTVDSQSEGVEFQITPEGHRAPLAEIFKVSRSRSVNTQTPVEFGSSNSSGSTSRNSLSPRSLRLIMDSPLAFSGSSQGSSPDNECAKFGTSPHINRFMAREPPDGCEKVLLKSMDETKFTPLEHAIQPTTFKLRPSLGSAFQMLNPTSVEEDAQIVSSQDL